MAANDQGQGHGHSNPHLREPGRRRPMCGVCTKPLRLCLCGRLRSPPLDNTVGVTILQHAMEADHPLNSTRVARLGLRNLAVARVTDVNHRARFLLRTVDGDGVWTSADSRSDGPEEIRVLGCDGCGEGTGDPAGLALCGGEILDSDMSLDGICGELGGVISARHDDYAKMGRLDLVDVADTGRIGCSLDGEVCGIDNGLYGGEGFRFQNMKRDEHHSDSERERPVSSSNQIENSFVNGINGNGHDRILKGVTHNVNGGSPHHLVENASEFCMAAVRKCNGICRENVEIGASSGQGWTVKNMDKCSIAYTEKELKIDIERGVKPKIRWLSRGPLGQSAVSNGFAVTKIQMKKSKLTGEVSEFEEFSIAIPPKSALLFPCQRAISIDASDCQVQHLIVLDGTWAKAQRMYHENPWLQLLPHVKLESDGAVSLYSEVRHEPRAGCLSTIESIVVAMRKLGENAKELDDVLDVFKSMIADQRRCKDENWKQKLKSQT